MAWYWYVAIYVAGYIVSWRVGYSWVIGRELARLEIVNKDRSKGHGGGRRCSNPYCCKLLKLDDDDRFDAKMGTAIASAFWPVLAIGFPAYLYVTSPTPAEKRLEQREAERAELNKLRKQAKELGLPFPEVDNTNQ
jgi:hypothetical protein